MLDGARAVADGIEAFLPPKRATVAEHATQARWLSNAGGGYVGRWRHEMAPYLVAPMECLTSLDYLTVAVIGPGQSGKTSIGENWLLHSVECDPADILWFMQTDEACEAYVKKRINSMVSSHDEMKRRLGRRPVDDSLHYKQFRGMSAEFLSATENNLINKSAPRILADEIDAYPDSLGDVKVLLDVRRQTFGRRSMLLAISHPDRARGLVPERDWTAGIMAVYADSDRRLWFWPCPHCGAWSSPIPTAARFMALEYPKDGTLDEIERGAHLLCPVNGCIIEDQHRREMNIAAFRSPFGGWIGEGQTIAEDGTVSGQLISTRTAGFWIVGVMSPFLIGGIGGLARARAKAEREFETSGEDKTLKEVVVKQWGYPYSPPKLVGSIDAETLAERAKSETQTLGVVPTGVRFLSAWVDVQIAHFEVLVRGWGVTAESWVIDKLRVPADTATDRDAWDKLFEGLLARRYELSDKSGRGMSIRVIGYDSGGSPGVSDQAYALWRRLKSRNVPKTYGVSEGRPMWSIIPTKGAATRNAPRLSVVYPDSQRKDRKAARSGTVPLALFNANLFKDDLAGQLQHALPGANFVHFPAELRSKEPPHTTFEQLTAEKRRPDGRWEKPHQGVRNEMLDLMVGTHVLARLHGLARINWENPPAWCAEWNSNSMVDALAPSAGEATKPSKQRAIFDLF